jgi:hypothetical protein
VLVHYLIACSFRCRAPPDGLDDAGIPRSRDHLAELRDAYPFQTLWDVFGVNGDVEVQLKSRFLVLGLLLICPPSRSRMTSLEPIFTS